MKNAPFFIVALVGLGCSGLSSKPGQQSPRELVLRCEERPVEIQPLECVVSFTHRHDTSVILESCESDDCRSNVGFTVRGRAGDEATSPWAGATLFVLGEGESIEVAPQETWRGTFDLAAYRHLVHDGGPYTVVATLCSIRLPNQEAASCVSSNRVRIAPARLGANGKTPVVAYRGPDGVTTLELYSNGFAELRGKAGRRLMRLGWYGPGSPESAIDAADFVVLENDCESRCPAAWSVVSTRRGKPVRYPTVSAVVDSAKGTLSFSESGIWKRYVP